MSGELTGFFYGTLMVPEIFYSVCYGQANPLDAMKSMHTFTPAVLNDYCRHRVQYADYPAIIAEEGHSVRGVYVTGLTDANMVKLDTFEGSEYEKTSVKVTLLKQDGDKEVEGEERDVTAYVFMFPERLEAGEWDFESFKKDRMRFWVRGGGDVFQEPDDNGLLN